MTAEASQSRTRREAPRYAVVTPTRNRAETLVETVKTIVAPGRNDVEIIAPDASDNPEQTRAMLAAAGLAAHVRHLPAPEGRRLSMRENWERGIDAATAPWLIFIGDDDALTPTAFDMLDALTCKPVSPVIAWEPADYRWPCYPGASAGQLSYSMEPPTLHFRKAEPCLHQHLTWSTKKKWPAIGPSIYHGAVHRELIERTRARHGRYFVSFIVDYASAIVNLAQISGFVYATSPLSILGASGKSNSAGLAAAGEAAKRYDDVIAENPGLAPLFPELAASRLHAPLVASGYREVFGALEAEFSLPPFRMLTSCVDELSGIVDPEAFQREREILIGFAHAHRLPDVAVRSARHQPPVCGVGADLERRQVFVDSIALGWRTVADVAANAHAFIDVAAFDPAELTRGLSSAVDALALRRSA